MDLKQLKELMQMFERSALNKMVIKEKGGNEVTLEKYKEQISEQHSVVSPPMRHSVSIPTAPANEHVFTPEGKKSLREDVEESGFYVRSPMVGTFYRSSSPEDRPYVKEGDAVEAGTVVCIIEAMKVMNEVKAGTAGFVKKVCMKDGEPVEFNSPLFVIQ